MLGHLVKIAALASMLVLAAQANASTLIEVIELGNGQNINTLESLVLFDEFEYDDLFLDGQPLFAETASSDSSYQGCEFDTDTVCTFSVDEYVDYVIIGASKYAALYAPWDGEVIVDTSTWGNLTNGSGRPFVPAISNIRAISAIPEPSAALLFIAGISVAGYRIRR